MDRWQPCNAGIDLLLTKPQSNTQLRLNGRAHLINHFHFELSLSEWPTDVFENLFPRRDMENGRREKKSLNANDLTEDFHEQGKKIYIYKYQERQSMGAFMRIIIIYRTDQQQRDREGKGEKNKSRLYTRVRAILTGPLTIIHHPWYLFFYFVYFFFHFFTLYTPIYVAHIISCARTREKTIRQTIKLFFIHTAGQTHTTKYLKKKKLRYNIIIITGVNSEFTRRDTRRCMRVYNEINEITRIKYYTRT